MQNTFKTELPHLKPPYNKRNWGSPLHSVCSYQGKLKPALAYHLVQNFSKEGDKVLDPFSGSGTIPFEAACSDRTGLGMDIGLLPTALTNAKVLQHDKKGVFDVLNQLEDYISRHQPSEKAKTDVEEIAYNKRIPDYYHPDTLREILLARDFFLGNPEPIGKNWSLVFACMLHILHGNRPYALSRNSHPITPYAPTGEFLYKNLIEKLKEKVERCLLAHDDVSLTNSRCIKSDILQPWHIEDATINTIITSPPFFDSVKFYATNWIRYWFCGWGKLDFQEKPKGFVETIQKLDLAVYDKIFNFCQKALVDNGLAVFHLGWSKKCDMANKLAPFALKYFKVEDIFSESVEHCQQHGIVDQGSVKAHQYMVLRKKSKAC